MTSSDKKMQINVIDDELIDKSEYESLVGLDSPDRLTNDPFRTKFVYRYMCIKGCEFGDTHISYSKIKTILKMTILDNKDLDALLKTKGISSIFELKPTDYTIYSLVRFILYDEDFLKMPFPMFVRFLPILTYIGDVRCSLLNQSAALEIKSLFYRHRSGQVPNTTPDLFLKHDYLTLRKSITRILKIQVDEYEKRMIDNAEWNTNICDVLSIIGLVCQCLILVRILVSRDEPFLKSMRILESHIEWMMLLRFNDNLWRENEDKKRRQYIKGVCF